MLVLSDSLDDILETYEISWSSVEMRALMLTELGRNMDMDIERTAAFFLANRTIPFDHKEEYTFYNTLKNLWLELKKRPELYQNKQINSIREQVLGDLKAGIDVIRKIDGMDNQNNRPELLDLMQILATLFQEYVEILYQLEDCKDNNIIENQLQTIIGNLEGMQGSCNEIIVLFNNTLNEI